MRRIFIESKHVVLGYDHLYLVYQDDDGNEFVIRGGPQYDTPPLFGNITVEAGILLTDSEDARRDDDGNPLTAQDRGSIEINLGGRDAADVWAIMVQHALNIGMAGLNYNAFSEPQNSNSTIASVLSAVAIDIYSYVPTNTEVGDLPGIGNLLSFGTKLDGSHSEDLISGNAGRDHLEGNGGNDTLHGGNDTDYLYGGTGDDHLHGDEGIDFLYGGDGSDTYYYSNGDGNDFIHDIDAGDRLNINGNIISSITQVAPDSDTYIDEYDNTYVLSSADGLVVKVADGGLQGTITIQSFSKASNHFGITFNDYVEAESPDLDAAPIIATDTLDSEYAGRSDTENNTSIDYLATTYYGSYGSSHPNGTVNTPYHFQGGTTNDSLIGGNYNDLLYGMAGDDFIDGVYNQSGNVNMLFGGLGSDHILGGNGSDYIWGNEERYFYVNGNDALEGPVTRRFDKFLLDDISSYVAESSDSGDFIDAGQGDDRVGAGEGDDLVLGGLGSDVVTGASGADVLIGNEGEDIILGDAYLRAYQSEGGLTVGWDYLSGTEIDQNISYDDVIDGGEQKDFILGGVGDDVVYGGSGDDDIHGDRHSISMEWQHQDASGNLQNDPHFVALEAEYHGNDILFGESGNDLIKGNGGDDVIDGGRDNDSLYGDNSRLDIEHHGDDVIYGGHGDDQIVGGGGSDVIDGGEGENILLGDYSWDLYGNIFGENGHYHGDDDITGGSGKDTIIGGGGNDHIVAGAGDDLILGDSREGQATNYEISDQHHGDDHIDAGAGNDTVYGDGGDDVILGGAGADAIEGGAGNDTIRGGADGEVDGVLTSDYLDGGAGDDVYLYELGDGSEHIADTQGRNEIKLGAGVESIHTIIDEESDQAFFYVNGGSDVIAISDAAIGQFSVGFERTGESFTYQDIYEKVTGDIALGSESADDFTMDADAIAAITHNGYDTVVGNGLDNWIYGQAGNDVLRGGKGQDFLSGGEGDDTYRIALDEDQTKILANSTDVDTFETVDLIDGISVADVLDVSTVTDSMHGLSIVLTFTDLSQVTFLGWWSSQANRIDQLNFSDANNTSWDALRIESLSQGASELDDSIRGFDGLDDHIDGLDGNDSIWGKKGNDVLYGGAGDDVINGGGLKSNGSVIIQNGDDSIYGGAGDDYILGGDGNDMLYGGDGNDEIRAGMNNYGARNGTSYLFGGDGNDKLISYRTYADGEGDFYFDGGEGDDDISGYVGHGQIDPGRGNDSTAVYSELSAKPVYIFESGDGRDSVSGSWDSWQVALGSGIVSEDLSFSIDLSVGNDRTGNPLILDIESSGDQIKFMHWFTDDLYIADREFEIVLEGGTIITAADILPQFQQVSGTAGDDLIELKLLRETIDAGAGNDLITGHRESIGDTFVFNTGWDKDVIQLDPQNGNYMGPGDQHQIVFGTGLSFDQFEFYRSAESNYTDLVIAHVSSGDSVTIKSTSDYIHKGSELFANVSFDGDVKGMSELLDLTNFVEGTEGDDLINGVVQDETIYGHGGNDDIRGQGGYDTIYGGTGDDEITGYGLFDGGEGDDKLVGGAIVYGREGDDVLESFGGDSIHFGGVGNDHFYSMGSGHGIYTFHGGAGDDEVRTEYTHALELHYASDFGQDWINVNDGNSSGQASRQNKLIFDDAFSINDLRLARFDANRAEHNDLLIYFANHANDHIYIEEFFGDPDFGKAFGSFVFQDGEMQISDDADLIPYLDASNGDNTLYALSGPESYLFGGEGDDTYVVSPGDGQVTINNFRTVSDAEDVLLLNGEYSAENVTLLRRDTTDLVLRGSDPTDEVTIIDFFKHDQPRHNALFNIDKVRFGDGTEWLLDDLLKASAESTPGDDKLYGSNFNDAVSGENGNDQLFGFDGDDLLDGGAGDDSLSGGEGNDILIGGPGDDFLGDNFGTNTFIYNTGDGNDRIYGYDGDGSRLVLGSGISVSNVQLSNSSHHHQGYSDLSISFSDQPGNIEVDEFFSGGVSTPIEFIEFDDGTIWDWDQIAEQAHLGSEVLSLAGNGQDDHLYGNAAADTLEGKGGNDVLYGFIGNDSLLGGGGADYLYGGKGDDILKAGSGDDHIYAGAGNDLAINGATGNDRYYFGLGGGNNSINNNDTDAASIDRIIFLDGVLPEAIDLAKSGNHLVFHLTQSGETLTVSNYYRDDKSKIDLVEFEGGEVWDQALIEQRILLGTDADDSLIGTAGADVLAGQAGNDTLDGGSGNDQLTGGVGNDLLVGGAGSDHYFYEMGHGDDVVSMQGQTAGDSDRLVFGDGLLAENATLTKVGGDLLVGFSDQTGSITLQSHFVDSQYEIDSIEFALGEAWDAAYINANVIASDAPLDLVGSGAADTLQGAGGDDSLDGKGGNDTLLGEGGNDTLIGGGGADQLYGGSGADILKGGGGHDRFYGGTGNDILTGGKGNDTYHFASGDGFDKINNGSNNFASETDVLSIDGGFSHDDLWFRKTNNHLDIYLLGSNDQVRVNNWYKANKFELDTVSAGAMEVDVAGIDALVSAMASFGAPQGGEVVLTSEEQSQVDAVIASSWQAA